jgi:hypothetical protein
MGPGRRLRHVPESDENVRLFSAPLTRAPQASKAHELRKQAPDIVFRWSLFLYLATSTLVLLSQPAYPAEPIVGPVYYVAPYGNDSHSKAQAANPSTPWRTLQKAAANVVAGDTIVVEDGIYTGGSDAVVRISDKSGTATNPIRFVSRNRWGATLDGQLRSQDVVALRNSNHIIIEGFEIKSGAARGIRSDVSSTSPQIISHITLRQNWIHHNGQVDPCATSQQSGALGHGVLMSIHSRYWTVDANLIHNNGKLVGSCSSMSHQHDHGLYMKGHGHMVRNNILFGQVVGYNLKMDGPGNSFDPPSDERSYTVINNTFAHTPVDGQIYRNIIMYSNSGYSPRNVLIANNVFWGAPPSGDISIRTSGGGWPWEGVEVVNNVSDTRYTFRPEHKSALLRFEGNIDNTTNPGIQGTTLGMVSPKALGATEDDFRLTADAKLLIDSGASSFTDQYRRGLATETSPMRDYVGTNRPQGYGTDIGAHERIR